MVKKVLKYIIRQLKKTFSKAYVISLIIAFLLWALIKFSALYQERVTFKVTLNQLPDTYVLLSEPYQQVNCVIKASGFRILLLKYWESQIIEANFNHLTKIGVSEYQLSLDDKGFKKEARWMNYAHEIQYENTEIIFNIEELMSKRVKVIPKINLKFKPGYILDHILLDNDSIDVYIPKSLLSKNEVYTYEKNVTDLSKSEQVELYIDLPKHWKMKEESRKIVTNIFVDQLTQGVFNLPIQKEEGIDIKYFPSRVEVKYSIPSKQFNNINPEDIIVNVENAHSEYKENSSLKVNVSSKPGQAQIISINPSEVEFLIFDNE